MAKHSGLTAPICEHGDIWGAEALVLQGSLDQSNLTLAASVNGGDTANMEKTVGNSEGVPWRVHDDVRPLAAQHQRPRGDVDAQVITDFARDGVAMIPGALVEWVEPLCAGLQRMLDRPADFAFPCDSTSATEPGRFFDSYCNWQLVPEFQDFVFTSKAASLAAAVMESTTAQLFHEHSFSKEAATQKATPWHHDLPYYCVDGLQTVSVYVALDETPAETAVRFLRGSHRSGQLHLPRNFSAGTDYVSADPSMIPVPDIAADDERVLVSALSPGDVIVFDFRTLHGTTAAPVASRRRAFSTRWLGDDVVFVDRPGETSPPLDGLGVQPGQRMREDWFPILWPNLS